MKIRLNEIPEIGRSYLFNRKTAELNSVLQDLISNNPYNITLEIKPLNTKDFTIYGSVLTETSEQCSKCAEDFNFIINRKIREILIPSPQNNKRDTKLTKYVKTPTTLVTVDSNDTDLNVSEYSNQQFDLGEFLHEIIALELPFSPHCANCEKHNSDDTPDPIFVYDEKISEDEKPNPFKSLKGIKLN